MSEEPIPEPSDLTWGDRYGEPVHFSPTERESAVWGQLGGLTCFRDPRLSKAARHHAETLAASPGALRDGRLGHLRFTLHQLGGFDYSLMPAVTVLDDAGIAFLRGVAEQAEKRWTHCGLGVAEGEGRHIAVLVGVSRTVEISSLPIAPTPTSRLRLAVRPLTKPSGDISLYFGKPDTTVVAVKAMKRGEAYLFDLPLHERGKYELELLHDRGLGPETAVLIPLFVGVEPDPRPTVVPGIDAPSDVDPEAALLGFLNSARKKVGLPPLLRDARLDTAARAHSSDMAMHHFFGHVSPLNGGLARRLERAGLTPKRSAENIAESSSPLRIHRNLMASPAHRLNMLSPVYTHVGIGVAGREERIATQIFAAW